MIFKRPLIVWLMSLFFGVPAVFFVVIHVLVLSGIISPPAHMASQFENIDWTSLAINWGEALFLSICIGFLFAMKRVSFPLMAIYFSIDALHNLSGLYLSSPRPPVIFIVGINLGVVAYVWNLRRKNLLN